jgi:hypothetical protein
MFGHLLQKKLKLWKSTSDVDNIVIDIEEEIEVPEFDDMIFLEAKKLNDLGHAPPPKDFFFKLNAISCHLNNFRGT